MTRDPEVLESFVVDIACLRKWRRDEVPGKAAAHTRQCSLEGHCLESGFALVDEDGRIVLLEPSATLKVAETVQQSTRHEGIRLRVHRQEQDGSQETVSVQEISSSL